MSKIAIILTNAWEYNTSSMLRCKTIIYALKDIGHQITCFTPYPEKESIYYQVTDEKISNITIIRYGKDNISSKSKELNEGKTSVLKAKINDYARRSFRHIDVFGATLLYLPYRKSISKQISFGLFDYMISFSDPMTAHMIGKYCKKNNPNLIYIQQWGDPLAADTIAKTAQPVWFRKIVENSLIKPADRVFYVSPFTEAEQKKIFPKQKSKLFFLPTPSLCYKEDDVFSSNKITMGYFGSYNSVARDIIPFYEAAVRYKDINFYIIGDSDIKLESKDNIMIIPRVSKTELDNYMKKINIIVCIMNKKGNQIPGKVYHDASSKKDILFIKDGEYGDKIQEYFQKFNHYTFVDNNVDSICHAFNNYVENGIPIREPVKEFEAKNIAKKILE